MLLPESHSSDYSVALPSLAKLTLCAAAIQAACFSFPADNPVVEKTAYSDIISPDPSNPSNWVVNRGTDDPAKGPASISWRHGAATSTLTIGASSGQTVKILGGEPLAAVLYYRAISPIKKRENYSKPQSAMASAFSPARGKWAASSTTARLKAASQGCVSIRQR